MHTPDTKTDGNQLLYRIQLEAGINHRALDGRMELRHLALMPPETIHQNLAISYWDISYLRQKVFYGIGRPRCIESMINFCAACLACPRTSCVQTVF